MPPVQPHFESYVAAHGLGERLRFYPGDFLREPLPEADVLTMGHILHDWSLDEKRLLVAKAHAALPPGGALIVYDAVIDDERRQNAFGLLMSLNMLIETPDGFDYTGADCQRWLREAGFRETYVAPRRAGRDGRWYQVGPGHAAPDHTMRHLPESLRCALCRCQSRRQHTPFVPRDRHSDESIDQQANPPAYRMHGQARRAGSSSTTQGIEPHHWLDVGRRRPSHGRRCEPRSARVVISGDITTTRRSRMTAG
ncbi:MAG: methyltransferase [Thermomicrobiales bacterium]